MEPQTKFLRTYVTVVQLNFLFSMARCEYSSLKRNNSSIYAFHFAIKKSRCSLSKAVEASFGSAALVPSLSVVSQFFSYRD